MTTATGRRGAVITGWGTALPPKIVTNDDLATMVDTSDEWIRDRTGIAERRIGGTTAGLAIEAGAEALARAGVTADQIDLVILATTTPDDQVPATASAVQHGLGLSCGAMDLNAACSGFMYGLVTAHAMIGLGTERILVVGSETLSRIVDWTDRTTCILFADGAGAVVLEACDGPGELLGWNLGSQGEFRHILFADVGGTLEMEGKEVFRQAVKAMAASANASMDQAGVTADDISLVIPHQANARIIDASMNRLGIPTERAVMVLQHTGNTSSATIPLALADALDNDRIAAGDLVLLVGFGAGMTSASAVLRWGG
ncbi:MAG: beta-ketoacyl-ACP synthase III [Acidimicrobiales bacterium]